MKDAQLATTRGEAAHRKKVVGRHAAFKARVYKGLGAQAVLFCGKGAMAERVRKNPRLISDSDFCIERRTLRRAGKDGWRPQKEAAGKNEKTP
jgi:hypothetical protein